MATTNRKAPPGCFWRGPVLWAKIKHEGREQRISLRTDDPRLARQRYAAEKTRIVNDTFGIEAKRTVEEVGIDWAKWIERQVGGQTVKRYKVSLKALKRHLMGVPICEINPKLIAGIIRSRQADGVSNATIKRDLGALSSIVNFAIDQG
jgi:integrase/recombinase XerD